MRDHKPQKTPLFMAVAFTLFSVVFAIVWTITALSIGAGFFSVFGLFFIGFAVARLIIVMKHASGRDDRSHTPSPNEENRYAKPDPSTESQKAVSCYCPSCGAEVGADHKFCNDCGRRLPERK